MRVCTVRRTTTSCTHCAWCSQKVGTAGGPVVPRGLYRKGMRSGRGLGGREGYDKAEDEQQLLSETARAGEATDLTGRRSQDGEHHKQSTKQSRRTKCTMQTYIPALSPQPADAKRLRMRVGAASPSSLCSTALRGVLMRVPLSFLFFLGF